MDSCKSAPPILQLVPPQPQHSKEPQISAIVAEAPNLFHISAGYRLSGLHSRGCSPATEGRRFSGASGTSDPPQCWCGPSAPNCLQVHEQAPAPVVFWHPEFTLAGCRKCRSKLRCSARCNASRSAAGLRSGLQTVRSRPLNMHASPGCPIHNLCQKKLHPFQVPIFSSILSTCNMQTEASWPRLLAVCLCRRA